MPGKLRITVEKRGAIEFLRRTAPKELSQEFDRGMGRVAKEFSKQFASRYLRKGIYQVRTRKQVRPPRKGQPSLPAKVRRAGFKATLTGAGRLGTKRVSLHTGNPAFIIKARGGTIRPRRRGKKWLPIREAGPGSTHGKIVALVKRVTVAKSIPFEADWSAFFGRAKSLLREALSKAIVRANKKIVRLAARKRRAA